MSPHQRLAHQHRFQKELQGLRRESHRQFPYLRQIANQQQVKQVNETKKILGIMMP